MVNIQKIIESRLKEPDMIRKPRKRKTGMIYESESIERLHPNMVKTLRDRKHSLGAHPAFPDSDESHFEEKLMTKRFKDVVDNYRQQFELEQIPTAEHVFKSGVNSMLEVIKIEEGKESMLEALAVELIREEYGITEDEVDIQVSLEHIGNVTLDADNLTPMSDEEIGIQFENHAHKSDADKEVVKRRMVNALIQGAAKKGHHLFNLADKDINKIDPLLLPKYRKVMASADMMYMIMESQENSITAGSVKIDFTPEGKPVIVAEAVIFPLLIHELIKGVMEVLGVHGLPEDKDIAKYVVSKADFVSAEMWDMRLGPAIWEKFTDCIAAENFKLKHHIFAELVALPVEQFNQTMREVLMGSIEGKRIIGNMCADIKSDIANDEYLDKLENDRSGDFFSNDELDNI